MSKQALDVLEHAPHMMATDAPVFQKEKHISYWLRCFRSPLPQQYTSMDANRMTLACFTISALDILGALFSKTKEQEREDAVTWIYRCQHPDGGFRAFPGTDFGERSNEANKVWDPANLPATYFALSALSILGDDLQKVHRQKTLGWLRRLQRRDGSFGEWLSSEGHVEGGMDTRYAYCGMIVRWILRGNASGSVEGVPDVDTDALASCIRHAQSYDGGIADEPFHESHAGFTYCALSALSAIDKLPDLHTRGNPPSIAATAASSNDHFIPNIRRFLIARLTTDIEDEPDLDVAESSSTATSLPASTPATSFSSTRDPGPDPDAESESSKQAPNVPAAPPPLFPDPGETWTGFAGRANKLADTCYAWWVGASLAQLGCLGDARRGPLRRYLLAKPQHLLAGGFGKAPGDPPDVYHSYLGLAALALLGVADDGDPAAVLEPLPVGQAKHGRADDSDGEDDDGAVLRRVDAMLCISRRARRWIESLPWRRDVSAA